MKQVILVRHAKSDWGNENLKDIDRFLSERGYNDAYFSAGWFNKNQAAPALIISSTATRALSTALIFARALDFNMDNFKLEKEIYEGSVERIISIIKEQDNANNCIMLFGHNPGFTNICNRLSDDLYFDNIPTCGMVSYTFDTDDWADFDDKKGKINFYKFPKDFKNND